MYKQIIGLLFIAAAVSAGLIETHQVVHEPVLAKVGAVVHSAPSAVSHQSFTRVHNNAVIAPVVAPVVKTTIAAAAPVVHAVHAAPIVHAATPVVHAAPIVHAATPVVHSVPVVHAAPVVHTYHAAPAAAIIHH